MFRLDNIICENKSQIIKNLMKTDIKIIKSHTTQEKLLKSLENILYYQYCNK